MDIERLLGHARFAAPSSQLHDRVTTAARQAWNRSPVELPWYVPLRRLALSAAATFLIASGANHFVNRITPLKQPYATSAGPVTRVGNANEDSSVTWSTNTLGRLSSLRLSRPLDPEAIRRRTETLRRLLDEAGHNGAW